MANDCYVYAALICREVSPGSNNAPNLTDVSDTLFFQGESVSPTLKLFFAIAGTQPGEHFIQCALITPSGQRMPPSSGTKVKIVSGRVAASNHITLQLSGMTAGTYWFEIVLDGKPTLRLPLTLQSLSTMTSASA